MRRYRSTRAPDPEDEEEPTVRRRRGAPPMDTPSAPRLANSSGCVRMRSCCRSSRRSWEVIADASLATQGFSLHPEPSREHAPLSFRSRNVGTRSKLPDSSKTFMSPVCCHNGSQPPFSQCVSNRSRRCWMGTRGARRAGRDVSVEPTGLRETATLFAPRRRWNPDSFFGMDQKSRRLNLEV